MSQVRAVAQPAAVEMRGVAKAFGACVANRDVTIRVERGTVHAVVGENGAGKSTCMKMLYGLYRPDCGEILIHGKARAWRSPRDAIAAGLGMVHQHFMLAGPYTGLDNIILGDEPSQGFWRWLPAAWRPIDRSQARRRLQELMAAYHLQVDLDVPVETLPVGVQQRLEILKLLYRGVDILILDEPTAVLTPQEVDEFFTNLCRLKDQGKTIIVITHKLGEVLRYADDVTVLRRGATVAERPVAGMTAPELAELMVGRVVHLQVAPPPSPKLGAEQLRLAKVTMGQRGEKPKLADLSLVVRSGEIVGIAGIEGNGQSDLLRLLLDPGRYLHRASLGQRITAKGEINVLGRDVSSFRAKALRALGLGVVPEDRCQQGLLLSQSLWTNFLLGVQRMPRFGRFGFIRRRQVTSALAAAIKAFDVRPADQQQIASGLSGGNQQKLIIAREFIGDPRLFICAQPTRGVDVGSIEFIHQRILDARAGGTAVLLISSALEEVMALADRILVFYDGKIVQEFRRGEADEARIGHFMGGGSRGDD